VIFCTFVGYVVGGPMGALAMTAGVFLPAFAFSMILYERLEAIMAFEPLRRFLIGVSAGVIGMMAVSAVQIGVAMVPKIPNWWAAGGIFLPALAVAFLWRSKWHAPAILVVAGIAGAIVLGVR
jgi:chromate transporter